jgi:hypothetical protein
MTPSLIKGENLRRPPTATGAEYASPGRGYHPYAVPGYVSQPSSSAQSSPASYPVPLGCPPAQAGAMGSVSRSSSGHRSNSSGHQLQDQMHQMLNLEQMDDGLFSNHSEPQQPYEDMYRTESPMPFTSAPSGSASNSYASTPYTASMPETQTDQFASAVDAGYFSSVPQPHHHVSM